MKNHHIFEDWVQSNLQPHSPIHVTVTLFPHYQFKTFQLCLYGEGMSPQGNCFIPT